MEEEEEETSSVPYIPHIFLPLTAPTPHILQQAVSLRQPVQAIVALAHGAHKPAQRVDLVLARVPPVLVYFANGYLHRCVVFGFDDPVCSGAFARHVAGRGDQLGGGSRNVGGMEEGVY